MVKGLRAAIVVVIMAGLTAMATGAVEQKALRDSFAPPAIDGKLVSTENGWFFNLDADLSDGTANIKAGTPIEILPSAALERMVADFAKRPAPNYRIWCRITRCKSINFIFLIYFVPISEAKQADSPDNMKPTPNINDPNDKIVIPEEVVAKLLSKKVVRIEQLEEKLELKQDFAMADRGGFIVRQKENQYIFTFDSMGRKIQKYSIMLLPCQALELAQKEQSMQPNTLRFKISGIITRYKGQHYLLLQQATPSYSHGNFGE